MTAPGMVERELTRNPRRLHQTPEAAAAFDGRAPRSSPPSSSGARPPGPSTLAGRAGRRGGGGVFAHSPWDGALVLVSVAETALLVAGTALFSRSLSALGAPLTALVYSAAAALLIFLNCTNYQCVAHNFIHNPFFRSPLHNGIFSVLNTLSLGVPQTLYRVHHLNHHSHGSDRKDPATGQTKDYSSIYRYSGDPVRPEPLLRYAFLGPLRMDVAALMAEVQKRRLTGQTAVEAAALVAFVAALVAADLRGALLFYLPVWYLGQVAAYAENYLEHNHAIPGSKKTDSVSCYGALYNLVWFNNGYHQEHHFRPQVHWLDIKTVRAEMLPDSERRIVNGAHWFNV